MKFIYLFILTNLFFILTACHYQKEPENKPETVEKEKPLLLVKRKIPLADLTPVKEAVQKNNYFIKLYESFKPENYSIDELVDLTNKDLQYIQSARSRHFKSKADTTAVKSRLVLTHINLKKMNFLLKKPAQNKDTIEKTLNALVHNINDVIYKINIYNQSEDEFKSILSHDSLAQIKQDSLFRQHQDSLKK